MAGYENREWILSIRRAHRARSRGAADEFGNVAISPRVAVWNPFERPPDAELETVVPVGRNGTENVSRAPAKYSWSCAIASTSSGSAGERSASRGQGAGTSSTEEANQTRVKASASVARKSEMPNGNAAEVQSVMYDFLPVSTFGAWLFDARAGCQLQVQVRLRARVNQCEQLAPRRARLSPSSGPFSPNDETAPAKPARIPS